jgi:LPS export ABC transporter protein LptC
MYLSLRSSIGVLILAAAAIATWLASRHAVAPRADSGNTRRAPLGYYLRDAVLLGTDAEGKIFYRVHAGLAEQQPDKEGLALSDVRVDYQDTEHVQWKLSAEHASAENDDSSLDLTGHVRLTNEPGGDGPGTVIETDALRLEPRRFVALSEAPVRISIGNIVLTATGLKAHLKDDTLELESQVHGQFFQ